MATYRCRTHDVVYEGPDAPREKELEVQAEHCPRCVEDAKAAQPAVKPAESEQ